MHNDEKLKQQWQALDREIRSWWENDLSVANEEEIRNDPQKTLLYLPHPYSTAGGSESAFPEMYCWDSYFINLALMEHERYDLVRNHIINHLFMIEKYGMVLNGNRNYYLTRSQVPLLAESVVRYFQKQRDYDLLFLSYPLLKKEYNDYWTADHHQTPTGLATNRDLGDPNWRPELASEAEIADFTACFDGDVRKCNPIMTNSALVKYAINLSIIADALGWHDEASEWLEKAEIRAALLRQYCWAQEKGFFFDYHYERGERLPYWSVMGFWPLWAKVATSDQAKRIVRNMQKFNQPYGLPITVEFYASPHPEYEWLQFGYPAGWPPMHIMPVEGLDNYGYHKEAETIAYKIIKLMLDQYQKTGKLWEKYNVVEGNLNLPVERYQTVPMHGFISATAVILGKRLFGNDRNEKF